MSIPGWIAAPIEAVSIWLNPQRKERAILLGAIESASELIDIYQKAGRYRNMSDEKRKKFEIHYLKRFNAWRDGRT